MKSWEPHNWLRDRAAEHRRHQLNQWIYGALSAGLLAGAAFILWTLTK